ncbi:hypothetical protein NUW54_g12737 [Trametes sanguinea]|uniref:Uncharacterized protein n=1 Tax=Trametes sanguinea TaxID=158606 RepID=A0ACC1MUQ6_9APHY|nr:hypothetical protein NUW54_g12737 [Trametes sanguinea]
MSHQRASYLLRCDTQSVGRALTTSHLTFFSSFTMFCTASLIDVALTLIAAASPVEERHLQPREGRHIVGIDRCKHRANHINLERNVGRQAFNEGAESKPLATAPSMNATKRQDVPLTEEDMLDGRVHRIPWPRVPRRLRHRHCRPLGPVVLLPQLRLLTQEEIHSFLLLLRHRGPARALACLYYSPVFEMSSDMVGHRIDGVLGLAYPAVSNLRKSTFFNTAISQGAVTEGAFGFMLGSPVSELYLGGVDSDLYTGSIECHSVDTSSAPSSPTFIVTSSRRSQEVLLLDGLLLDLLLLLFLLFLTLLRRTLLILDLGWLDLLNLHALLRLPNLEAHLLLALTLAQVDIERDDATRGHGGLAQDNRDPLATERALARVLLGDSRPIVFDVAFAWVYWCPWVKDALTSRSSSVLSPSWMRIFACSAAPRERIVVGSPAPPPTRCPA